MELEVFVHGALCIAYWAAAYLGLLNRRDPNQGTCTRLPLELRHHRKRCRATRAKPSRSRWTRVSTSTRRRKSRAVVCRLRWQCPPSEADKVYLLEGRPGQLMPIMEANMAPTS